MEGRQAQQQSGIMSQLKLSLTRDPRIATPNKQQLANEEKTSPAAIINLVGGVKSSSSASVSKPTLTQTHLFAKPKVSPIPVLKSNTGVQSNAESVAITPQAKPQPSPRTQPSKPLPAHAKLIKASAVNVVSRAKVPATSMVSHIRAPGTQVMSQVPVTQVTSHIKVPGTRVVSHVKAPASQVKSPFLQEAKPPSVLFPKVESGQGHSSKISSGAMKSPPLLKEAGKRKLSPEKTITVTLPTSLAVLATSQHSLVTTSTKPQTITVKIPPSLLTNPFLSSSSALPAANLKLASSSAPSLPTKTTSSLPAPPKKKIPKLAATTSVAPSKSHASSSNHPLSPPKPKRAKVMKTAVLPISRIKTIMKTNVQSSQPSLQLSQDSVMMITKAAVS